MRIANIIIFHKNPASVGRLIRALQCPGFDFYLHLDKKVDVRPFAYLSNLPNTSLVKKRVEVNWGGFSQLEALVASLQQVFQGGRSYDFINLLSGQDYPIKPASEIKELLSAYRGKSFLIAETPPSAWWEESMRRITKYHLTDYNFRGKYRLETLLSRLLPERKFPLPVQLYGGPYGSYWILSFEAARYVYNILSRKDLNWLSFKHMWAPDEFLIHTLLMNSPFKDEIIGENYHYIDRSPGGAHPKILTTDDFLALQNSHKLFARKFDPETDPQILDMIDEKILSK